MTGGTYAVIGDPIDHSLSPAMHSAAFRELGMDCSYIAYRVPRGELEEGVDSLRGAGISGFNVTIPHKEGIMGLLDRTDETCSLVGAANTVKDEGGSLRGYNTDMGGFLEPLKGAALGGASALLLGAGGAARAIAAGLAREGASKVTIANRTPERGRDLAAFAGRLGLEARAVRLADVSDVSGYDLIVNATAAGMGGGPSPVPLGRIDKNTIAYDIVYMPMRTGFVREAQEAGARVIHGYEMLLGQAALAFEIWHGREAPRAAMKRALLGGA